MMKVLVCGGRKYARRDLVYAGLDRLNAASRIALVIHGACTGADTLAGDWAAARGVPVADYPIEAGEGGFARNLRMLEASQPDLVVHFPGGNGTKHMRDLAIDYGVNTLGGLARPITLSLL